ncbi:MAG: HlyD family efflux transporter periplasmic adaptor subunit, partial [Chlamydiia bacterium]|nr:HlyD family efflux transporter periplasmic adaptor subunit [Chlamydiia bacterium]
GWKESLIIQYLRPEMTILDLLDEIEEHTGTKLTEGEVQDFFEDAYGKKLLILSADSEQLAMAVERRKMNPFSWLLRHHLFIRIPIFHPDRFLKATLPYVRPLVSTLAIYLYALISILGLVMLFGRFDEYVSTFVKYLNLQGVVFYLITISLVRVIHELAHAYTARHYGIPVPTLGIVFIVFFPTFYTDVTHSWKLWDRKKRLMISSAGILIELVLAGISTLLWSITEPGIFKNIFFLTSSVTVLASLLINLNVALRYDGYFMLADYWGIDNLRTEAFAATRWWIWKRFFGINTPSPNQHLTDRHLTGLLVYTFYCWFYRFFLYLAIGFIVYKLFTKVLGIILVAAQLWLFLLLPLIVETRALWNRRQEAKVSPTAALFLGVLGTFLVWFILPWPHPVSAPAAVVSRTMQAIHVPFSSQIEQIYVKNGENVEAGDPIIDLRSETIDYVLKLADLKVQLVDAQLERANYVDRYQKFVLEKDAERTSALEERKRYLLEKEQLQLKASVSGKIYGWDENLHAGEFVRYDQLLGSVADPEDVEAAVYVPEGFIDNIHIGEKVTFTPVDQSSSIQGVVLRVQKVRELKLSHMALAVRYGGPLPLVQTKGEDQRSQQLLDAHYLVEVELSSGSSASLIGQTGSVEFYGHWSSKLWGVIRHVLNVFWRESGV